MAARSGVTWYIPGLDNGRRVEKRYQKQCAHREVRGTRFFTSHIRLFTVCSVGFHLLCRLSEVDVRNHFYLFCSCHKLAFTKSHILTKTRPMHSRKKKRGQS